MQAQQNTTYQQYSINYYTHRLPDTIFRLDIQREQIIIIKNGSLIFTYQDTPDFSEDVKGFQDIVKVSFFKSQSKQLHVIAIKLKNQDKTTVSFRVATRELAVQIIDVINNGIKEFNKLPDYSDLLFQRESIIDKIKDSEPEYREVYNIFKTKISVPKLRSLLFQNHRVMIDYKSAALAKGFQLNKNILITQIKQNPLPLPDQPHLLQGYDISKTLEGIRLQDDQKKLRFVPNSEDIDQQYFFNSLPDVKEKNIWDQFEKISEQKMQIEDQQRIILQKQSDLSKVHKIILPKPTKGKYKISQSKEIFDRSYMKQQKRKQQRVQLNVDFAKRVTLTLKLFYKLSKYKNTTIEEITHIENQLHRLANSQPRPAPFLENAINKTLKNILKWKRQYR